MKFSSGSTNERETVWRFLNNQLEKPKINNISLSFGTYQTNYPDFYFFKLYQQLVDKQNEKEIIKLCLKHKQPSKALEKYFPQIFFKINQLPAKYFSTKIWMFLNDTDQLPKCPVCGKPINERKDFSQFTYCSQKCVRQNISMKSIEKAKQIYRRFMANRMGKLQIISN